MIIINGIEMDDGVDEPNEIEPDGYEDTENVTDVTPPATSNAEKPTNPVWDALALHGLIPKP